MSITLITCFYKIKSKFIPDVYYNWAKNLINNVNNFNLVIFTDEENKNIIEKMINNKNLVKIILRPIEYLSNYKYKDNWIKNQEKNIYLQNIDWKLQLLWSEKINFVYDCIANKYFDTDFYGWTDIGYFRSRHNDITNDEIKNWPSQEKINLLNTNKIYYANTNNDKDFMNFLFDIVKNKNDNGLPKTLIPHTQNTIAGGFFITHKQNIEWWKNTFDNKLKLYFNNDYLIKDDQIILVDCIMSDVDKFIIIDEQNHKYDNWFMFQRFLL
jgi:hypothetical protein